jgi:hypothetical protein
MRKMTVAETETRHRDRFEFGRVQIRSAAERQQHRQRQALINRGLSDADIAQIQTQAAKLARLNGGGPSLYAAAFLGECLRSLASVGLITITPPELMAMIKLTEGVPPDLLCAVVMFVAKHVPWRNDAAGLADTIQRGLVLGVSGLAKLHQYSVENRTRKARKAAKLAQAAKQAQAPAKPRPVLNTVEMRAQAKTAARTAVFVKEAAEREALAVKVALDKLYRHRDRLKPWQRDFAVAAVAQKAAGYEMLDHQRKLLFEILKEIPAN